MNTIKRKQHFVPQCYLKKFANENKLFVLDKLNKDVYSADIKDVAQDRYFYNFPDSFLPEEFREKLKAQLMEDELSHIEFRFEKILTQIIDFLEKIEKDNLFDSHGVLDEDAKKEFAFFLTLQLARTKTFRKQIEDVLYSLDELKKRLDQALVNNQVFHNINLPHREKSTNCIDFNDLIKVSPEEDSIFQHLAYLSDLLDSGSDSEISKILSSHIWLWGINSTSIPIWTSDNPIVIKPHEDFGSGISSHGVQVIYPISTKHLLIMFEPSFWNKLKNLDGMSIELSENDVNSYNKLQVIQSIRQTYSKENNFEFLLT